MSTDSELRHAAAALAAEASVTTQGLVSTLTAADPMPSISARAIALRAENDRRARAGVRVVTTPEGFGARHIAMLTDAFAATEARAQTFARGATDLAALLTRSLVLLAQMGDALAKLERVAAERERIEAEALATANRPPQTLAEALAASRALAISKGWA